MKMVYKVDAAGFYIEDALIPVSNKVNKYEITIQPSGLYKPRWDGVAWVEGDPIVADRHAKQLALDLCYAKRKEAYPPQSDYLDAVVKGDTVAQQAYIDACLAVKAKYPKPV